MLHREYFPFLPLLESTPQGPVDHPMLEATAPQGWWDESARILFGAAENIARILQESSECGVHLMTPFAGFCAFSAGYLNLYVYHFPKMNLGRSLQAKACMEMCLDYLNMFRKVWTIADGWVSALPVFLQTYTSDEFLFFYSRLKLFNKHRCYTRELWKIDCGIKAEPGLILMCYTSRFTSFGA